MTADGMKPAESLRGARDRDIEPAERGHEDVAVCRQLTSMSDELPMTRKDAAALDIDDRAIAIHRGRQGTGAGGRLRIELDISEDRLEQRERRGGHCGDREGLRPSRTR